MATNVKAEDALVRSAETGLTIRQLFPYQCNVSYVRGTGTLRRQIGERLRSDATGEYVIMVDTDSGGDLWIDTYYFTDTAGAMMLRLSYSGVHEGVTQDEADEDDATCQRHEVEWEGKFHGFMGSDSVS